MIVSVEALDRDEGTVVVFRGRDSETGKPALIAVDHRMAQTLIEVMAEAGDVLVEVEAWQVIG